MIWIKDRPTQEGEYWFWGKDWLKTDPPVSGLVKEYGGSFVWYTAGNEEWDETSGMDGWWAKQEVPAPPSDDAEYGTNSVAFFSSVGDKPVSIAHVLHFLCGLVHSRNQTWWKDPATGLPLKRNVGEMLMLVVSELAEAAEDAPWYHPLQFEIVKHISKAMEGHRKNLPDDKLPHRSMFEVEMADAIIRIFDISGGLGLDLGGAFVEKMQYNAIRADHKPENRVKADGKKY